MHARASTTPHRWRMSLEKEMQLIAKEGEKRTPSPKQCCRSNKLYWLERWREGLDSHEETQIDRGCSPIANLRANVDIPSQWKPSQEVQAISTMTWKWPNREREMIGRCAFSERWTEAGYKRGIEDKLRKDKCGTCAFGDRSQWWEETVKVTRHKSAIENTPWPRNNPHREGEWRHVEEERWMISHPKNRRRKRCSKTKKLKESPMANACIPLLLTTTR